MRLPYAPDPPPNLSPIQNESLHTIRSRRGDAWPTQLDLTILHSLPVLTGWSSFFHALRNDVVLEEEVRLLAITRTTLLNRAWYAYRVHRRALSGMDGWNEGTKEGRRRWEIVEMVDFTAKALEDGNIDGKGVEESSSLTLKHEAVLRYADAITKDVVVSGEVFEGLKEVEFCDREIVELTAVIAGYNCVSRFLVALDVGEMNPEGAKQK